MVSRVTHSYMLYTVTHVTRGCTCYTRLSFVSDDESSESFAVILIIVSLIKIIATIDTANLFATCITKYTPADNRACYVTCNYYITSRFNVHYKIVSLV